MKILHINKFYYIHGGVDSFYFDLTELLKKEGNKVIPFSMKDHKNFPSDYSKYFISNIDVNTPLKITNFFKLIKIAGRFLYSFEAKKKLQNLINIEKPDIAHLHHIYHHISPSILGVLKKNKIPTVLTLHDYKLICPNYSLLVKDKVCEKCQGKYFYNAVKYKCVKNSFSKSILCAVEMYLHTITKIYEKNIDTFISPSEFLKQKMIQYRFSEKQIVTIPHFINIDLYEPNYNFDKTILYMGRLEYIKGIDTLLKGFKLLKKKDKIKLKIAGDGRLRNSLEDYCKKENLSDVEFLGFQNKENLIKLIQECMFVVVPSRWYENSPIVIYEAFACGKPVIATNMGGITELVKDGFNGYLFEADNVEELVEKIDLLLEDYEKIIMMGKNARKFVEDNFNPTIYYNKLMSLYKNLVKEL